MSQNKARSRAHPCLLIFLLFLCVIVAAGFILPTLITNQAEREFGSPSKEINTAQRIYLSALILLQANDLTQPVNPGGVEVNVLINQGESVPSIIGKLRQAGLITNPGVFRSYLQYTGLDTRLKSGEFQLSPSMSAVEIAQSMQSSISPNVTLTILAGWRIEEIASSLPTSGLSITAEDFQQAAHSRIEGYSFSSCQNEISLEGYLFPDSYTLKRETTLGELLSQVLMNFEARVSSELRNGFTIQNLDLCQAVTLASIAQREAVVEEEMPLIASVFYNRLKSGSELASDPTVQYALGYNDDQKTWWTNPLSNQDLKVDSPYNTYLYRGLPPGPISNPGLAALKAVAFPAQTPYFYFRSACDGSGRHQFAETFEEHVANECP